MNTNFPTRVPWFVNFIRGTNLRMGIMSKSYFEIYIFIFAVLQMELYQEYTSIGSPYREREAEFLGAVMIRCCGV